MLFRFSHSTSTAAKMGCRSRRLGSELMAVRSRGTKSKTWAVLSVWKASLGGNCGNTGERGSGMKSMQRNADIVYQLGIWCGAKESYGTL